MRIGVGFALFVAMGCAGKHAERGDDADGAGGGGTAALGGSGGNGGTAGRPGTGGVAATSGIDGTGGTPPGCGFPSSESLAFGVKDPSGAALRLDAVYGGSFSLHGTVRSVEGASFRVEGCGVIETRALNAPGAGGEGGVGAGGDSPGGAGGAGGDACGLWTIEAASERLVLPVATDMRVSVAFSSWCQPFSGCNQTMVVRDELADGEPTLLATYSASFGGHTGTLSTPIVWPVTLVLVDLGCFPAPTDANRGPTTWALRMTGSANPDATVLLYAGETRELALDAGSDERWLGHNVVSSDAGGYDATSNIYFYLVKQR